MSNEAAISRTPIQPPRPSRLRRCLRWLAVPMLLALAVNLIVAISLSMVGTPSDAAATSATEATANGDWTVSIYDKPGSTLITSTLDAGGLISGRNWSPSQVCGHPNTLTMGDVATAWASATQDGQVEWLDLTYPQAAVPKSLRVYETYNPGALMKVVAYPANGQPAVDAWQGTDPTLKNLTAVQPTEIPLSIETPTKRVRIYLDSPNVPGWNEIDAVGLVDQLGNVQWATGCRASSFYGQSAATSGSQSPADLLPAYLGFDHSPKSPGMEWSAGFGWPLRALWTPIRTAPPPLTSSMYGAMPLSISSYASPTSILPMTVTSGSPSSGSLTTGTIITSSSSLSFSGSSFVSYSPLPTKVEMPYQPGLAGLVVNTLVYLPALLLLRWLLTAPRRFFAEVSRIRRGACLRCGYDLGYDFVQGCPECGWRRDVTAEISTLE